MNKIIINKNDFKLIKEPIEKNIEDIYELNIQLLYNNSLDKFYNIYKVWINNVDKNIIIFNKIKYTNACIYKHISFDDFTQLKEFYLININWFCYREEI